MVYIDEAGFNSYYYRPYARALRGQKVLGKINGRKFARTSLVAAQLNSKIIAPLEYQGTMNGDLFETWFEYHLIPEIPKDSVTILDNAAFHRKKKLYAIAAKYNISIIFLPPYSPELNDIEHFWHWLKQAMADTLLVCTKLSDALALALSKWSQRFIGRGSKELFLC